jgi:predicted acyltransferase
MAAMVIVNNPGDWSNIYWPLGHAEWDGWTPTDLIFPYFLFIVGVAITLSRKTTSAAGILRRSALLIGLGWLLSGFPFYDLTTIRIPGVLQRIGLCYLACAFAYRWARGTGPTPRGDGHVARRLAYLAAATLVGYWLVLLLVPGATGHRADLSPEGNVGAVIDRWLFTGHMWKERWDPEGLLSTVPSIGTTVLGLLAGLWMRIAAREPARVVRGLMYGGLGAALAGAVWSLWLPMIKNIWTSSYAMFSAGLGAITLAACYWAIDVRGWRWWTKPFVVLGTNAITLYVVSGLVARLTLVVRVEGPFGTPIAWKTWLYRTAFEPLASPVNASLLFAIANLGLLYLLLWWMYRRGVFLKV